ncbi:MAG: radical SAM protein [Nannocystaceae bacterium]|nr:radical SAM protein [Nannocystaceae bacterium]
MSEPALAVAAIAHGTASEGPHRRVAVWVRGCTLACRGCCNPELHAAAPASALAPVLAALDDARARGLEGLTVVGGEPLQQLAGTTALCTAAAARGLGVIVFTGYTPDEARALPGFDALWSVLDTLVAGRYDARLPERARAFVGSRNQALLHRTARYADAALWQAPGSAELVITPEGTAQLVGAPQLVTRLRRALAVAKPTARC